MNLESSQGIIFNWYNNSKHRFSVASVHHFFMSASYKYKQLGQKQAGRINYSLMAYSCKHNKESG